MWAIRRGAIAKVDLPARDRDLVGLPVDINARTEAARRLLHAPGISSSDRLAGALVVLSRITRLTVDDVDLAERWLFPGAAPGRPIGALALGRRLKRLGIDCATQRRTALVELSRQVPAPLLAALLGIHVNTAARWGSSPAVATPTTSPCATSAPTAPPPPTPTPDLPARAAPRMATRVVPVASPSRGCAGECARSFRESRHERRGCGDDCWSSAAVV